MTKPPKGSPRKPSKALAKKRKRRVPKRSPAKRRSRKLALLRARMDRLDQKMADLLLTRLDLSLAIITEKNKLGLPAHDPKREREVLSKLKLRFASDAQQSRLLKNVYSAIFSHAVRSARR